MIPELETYQREIEAIKAEAESLMLWQARQVRQAATFPR